MSVKTGKKLNKKILKNYNLFRYGVIIIIMFFIFFFSLLLFIYSKKIVNNGIYNFIREFIQYTPVLTFSGMGILLAISTRRILSSYKSNKKLSLKILLNNDVISIRLLICLIFIGIINIYFILSLSVNLLKLGILGMVVGFIFLMIY